MMSLQDRMGPVASISKLSTHITKPHLIIAKGVTLQIQVFKSRNPTLSYAPPS